MLRFVTRTILPGFKAGLAIAALGAVFGFGAVQAQQADRDNLDPVKEPGVPILSFDVENIGPILTEMGYIWEQRRSPEGIPFILVNADGKVVFVLSPLSCRGNVANTGCLGMQYIAVFEGQPTSAAVQAFNNRYAFANLGINNRGNAYLNRYDIADYGIARGNVAVLIDTFADLAVIYQATTAQNGATSASLDTEKVTPSSKVEIVASTTAQIVNAASISTIRTSEAANNLKRIFADDALPKNKITNIGQ